MSKQAELQPTASGTTADWMSSAFQAAPPISIELILGRAGLALVLGFVVAGVYRISLPQRRGDAPALTTTLVLLALLIALVTIVIGDNMARAFGLVGALSIVRFRTVVEDTRDTAFVIFSVVVGMAVGAGYPMLALIGIPAVAIAAIVMRLVGGTAELNRTVTATLVIRVGVGHDPKTLLDAPFASHLSNSELKGIATARQGVAFDLTYSVRLKQAENAMALIADLNRIEGIQGVELKQ
jgi:hypothetical protein